MTPDFDADLATALLQEAIRAQCVNDGTPDSGHESRIVALLEPVLDHPALTIETIEPHPGRRSIVARLEGRDPSARRLCLLGHTDVVPASPRGWRHDPYGGELIDGEVWGRGAVDMLNMTCTMAVALAQIARAEVRPHGDLVFAAVADEEAGGEFGAKLLLDDFGDLVAVDDVITESGGLTMHREDQHGLTITVAEKGAEWRRLVIAGTQSHASLPFRAVNAVVIASQVVSRLAAAKGVPVVDDSWRQLVPWLGLPEMLEQRLKDTREITTAIEEIEDPVTARIAYSCTHMTVAPTVIHGGGKTNVIPDEVIIEVDVRTLPGMTADEVDYLLMECIGEDLETFVTIERLGGVEATRSSTDTNLYRALGEVANELSPGAVLVPTTTVGSTDAAFFRQAEINAYGFALFSRGVRPEDFRSRFHGPNERIDLASLALTGEAWLALARRW